MHSKKEDGRQDERRGQEEEEERERGECARKKRRCKKEEEVVMRESRGGARKNSRSEKKEKVVAVLWFRSGYEDEDVERRKERTRREVSNLKASKGLRVENSSDFETRNNNQKVVNADNVEDTRRYRYRKYYLIFSTIGVDTFKLISRLKALRGISAHKLRASIPAQISLSNLLPSSRREMLSLTTR